jgi:hypothetical protein
VFSVTFDLCLYQTYLLCKYWIFSSLYVFVVFKVDVEVDRDPNRLLKPTAGWTSRLKDKGSSGSGPVLHMPHRYNSLQECVIEDLRQHFSP